MFEDKLVAGGVGEGENLSNSSIVLSIHDDYEQWLKSVGAK